MSSKHSIRKGKQNFVFTGIPKTEKVDYTDKQNRQGIKLMIQICNIFLNFKVVNFVFTIIMKPVRKTISFWTHLFFGTNQVINY